VEGLAIRNFRAGYGEATDRPAIIFDDVLDAELDGFRPERGSGQNPVVWFHEVVGALVRGVRLRQQAPLFLRVSGSASAAITLTESDLRPAQRPWEATAGAPANAVHFRPAAP
jgi:hypothetical protein